MSGRAAALRPLAEARSQADFGVAQRIADSVSARDYRVSAGKSAGEAAEMAAVLAVQTGTEAGLRASARRRGPTALTIAPQGVADNSLRDATADQMECGTNRGRTAVFWLWDTR